MKTLLFALAPLTLVGCGTLKPVGPLAKETPIAQQSQPLPNAPAGPGSRPPTVRPTPPTLSVTPADVDPNNPYDAAGKLTDELSIDSKPTTNLPVTVETSRIRGGVKQQ